MSRRLESQAAGFRMALRLRRTPPRHGRRSPAPSVKLRPSPWLRGLSGGALAAALLTTLGCAPTDPLPADLRRDLVPPSRGATDLHGVGDLPADVTFSEHVSPIVYGNCAVCHRVGESGPFELTRYEEVRSHCRQIAEVTASGYMPPWLPGPGTHAFVGSRRLDPREIALLDRWADQGCPQGDPTQQAALPPFVEGWQLGRPDAVVRLEAAYEVPAVEGDLFRNFVLPTGLERRRYVQSVEFRPDNRRVVHHATIAVDTTPRSRLRDREDPEVGFDGMVQSGAERPDGHLIGWVPGKQPVEGDPELAWALEPGADLVVQLHLQPTGRVESVRPIVGLHFADEPPTRHPLMLRLGAMTLDIPAGVRDYTIEDSFVLPVAVDVHGLVPHAHYLARRMLAWADLPDGTREWLLDIEAWDFNWQDEYRYVSAPRLPKGSTLSMRYVYDNGADNPHNPYAPPRPVRYGPHTTDEMGDLWIQVSPVDEAERAVLEQEFAVKDRQMRIRGYQHLLQDYPEDFAGRVDLGTLLAVEGRVSEAVEVLQQAIDQRPDDALAQARLGQILRDARDGRAVDYLRTAVRLQPDIPELHYNLGQALTDAQDWPGAEQAFAQAASLRPSLAAAHFNWGNALLRQRKIAPAIERLERAVTLQPAHAQAHNNLGSARAIQGDLSGAIRAFQRAVSAEPDHARAHYNLASALAQTGQLREAEQHFARATALRPDHVQSREGLAAVRRQLGTDRHRREP